VLVVGIGNSGVDIANELCRVSSQVWVSTRRYAAPSRFIDLTSKSTFF
jgi:cation diffusion facilitator CzcD-associated flavoprotein CzcO